MAVVVKNDTIQIERLELGPFGTNTYILSCQKTRASVIIDAPGEAAKVLKRLEGTHPKYILMTHNHMDHVDALSVLKTTLKAPIAAHKADRFPVKPDQYLNDGDVVLFGEIRLNVLHTPGHTPGSLCFFTGKYLISGDTLFPGGPGKTWSADAFKQIIESLTSKIFILPDATEVYPGHGDASVLKREKQEFEVFSSKSHAPDLCGDIVWLSS